jgi:putative ABC transport system permease protein
MRFLEGIRLALEQIRAQKLKSFFALIGVLIGVMFLITVVSVVEGMNRYMEDDFARQVYGLNTVTIRRTPSVQMNPSESVRREWRRRPTVRSEDAEAIRARLTTPALVAASVNSSARISNERGDAVAGVWVTAASGDYFRIREHDVERGRLFGPAEERLGAPVVVLGAETAGALFGSLDPIGRTVRIRGTPFQVIGVLEKRGSLFGVSMDNRAIAPLGSLLGRVASGRGVLSEVLVRTGDAPAMGAAMIELEGIMREQRRLRPLEANNFEIETAEDSMSTWARISRILFIAFPGLVAIALVVGGMVIMNIMLLSVTERTREIGIRRALGARRRDIVLQVLVESATLSGAGAALGIILGTLLAMLVRAVSPLPAAIAPTWITVAVAMGIGVGILAGVYPALRAARMDPVVALRFE